jgi:hypothetical protein
MEIKKKKLASRFLSYPIPSPLTYIIYIASNDRIILKSHLEKMRNGAAVAYLLLLSQHLAEGNEKPKSRELLSARKSEPRMLPNTKHECQ